LQETSSDCTGHCALIGKSSTWLSPRHLVYNREKLYDSLAQTDKREGSNKGQSRARVRRWPEEDEATIVWRKGLV